LFWEADLLGLGTVHHFALKPGHPQGDARRSGRASRSPCPHASAMRTAELAWRQARCSAEPGREEDQGPVAPYLIGPKLAAR